MEVLFSEKEPNWHLWDPWRSCPICAVWEFQEMKAYARKEIQHQKHSKMHKEKHFVVLLKSSEQRLQMHLHMTHLLQETLLPLAVATLKQDAALKRRRLLCSPKYTSDCNWGRKSSPRVLHSQAWQWTQEFLLQEQGLLFFKLLSLWK